MKKLILLIAVFAFTIPSLLLAESTQMVVVNGETLVKVAARITFDGDNVTVWFNDNTSMTSDMNAVTITFSNPSSIRGLSTFQLKKEVDEQLSLEGLAPGTEVIVFDTAGKAQLCSKSNVIDVRSLKSGIYMLKAGSQIVKFVKR